MDVFEAIAQRHSYRERFTDRPVPREDLRRIVAAGLQAPSGKNLQTTRFVIVDDPALLAQIAVILGVNDAVKTAKAIIFAIIDRDPEPVFDGVSFQVEDCSAAVENMLLAVTALGYATVWIDGGLRVERRAERIGELIGLPPEKVIRIALPIGAPAVTVPRREKMAFEERAWFNRYGG